MASVQTVYRTLKDLANKEQKGFITPAVFNRFAHIAQINIYNELFSELVDAKKIMRQNLDPGRDKSMRKRKLEDLSNFIVRNPALPKDSGSDNIFYKPANFSRLISMSVSNDSTYSLTKTNIEIVYDVEKMDKILGSNLSTPTDAFPVALISDEIEVFPSTITSIDLMYYRIPGGIDYYNNYVDDKPTYATEDIGGNEIANVEECIDFMLPEHFSSELVMEIAKLMGVRLRDQQMTAVAQQEEAKQ